MHIMWNIWKPTSAALGRVRGGRPPSTPIRYVPPIKVSRDDPLGFHLPVACETSKIAETSSSSTSNDAVAVSYRMEACLRFILFSVPLIVSCVDRFGVYMIIRVGLVSWEGRLGINKFGQSIDENPRAIFDVQYVRWARRSGVLDEPGDFPCVGDLRAL